MRKFFKKETLAGMIFPAFLLAIVLFLAWKNFVFGTFLSGWDSLHPEFNFPLYFKRALSGVWRADQGLGNLAAHAHMSDMPRVLFLWLSSLFLPVNSLRYVYLFLTLFLGSLGVYSFTNHFFGKSWVSRLASFLAAIFYLFNLTTLQHFFVPFEMFLTLYAFLPWVFLSTIKYLEGGGRKKLLTYVLFLFFLMPSAYAPSLFYAFLICFFIFLSIFTIFSKDKLQTFKRSLAAVVVLLLLNSYWIFPNIYSAINQVDTISNSKINLLFSPEVYLRNLDYSANLGNILTGKNFLFSWRAFDFGVGQFDDLLGVWTKHLSGWVYFIGLSASVISVLGLVWGIFKREKIVISLSGIFLLSFFFLGLENPPLGFIYSFLLTKLPVLKEVFRMGFTKFSIPFTFVLSFSFGYFFNRLFLLLKKIKFLTYLITFSVFGLLAFYFKPALEGNLIHTGLKTKIPNEYFEMFDWLEGREGRIARLPMDSVFNWEYHNWGYEGSAWFLWFGADNPILDRDFDRWSSFNENFYNEGSDALYKKDTETLLRVLEKYRVKYLLLDDSAMIPAGDEEVLFLEETKKLFEESGHIKEVKEFGVSGEGLIIYETDFDTNFVWSPRNYTFVDAETEYSDIDNIYLPKTAYVFSEDGTTYPFSSFDSRGEIGIGFDDGSVEIKSAPLNFSNEKKLVLPEESFGDFENMSIAINDAKEVVVSYDTEIKSEDLSVNRGFEEVKNCDLKSLGGVDRERQGDKVTYKAWDGGVSCDYLFYLELFHNKSYVLRIKGENREGRSLKIYLYNPDTKRMDLEELLPEGSFDKYFVIQPSAIGDWQPENESESDIQNPTSEIRRPEAESGYTLNLETRSFGSIASENVIEKIEVAQVPLEYISNIKLMPFDATLQGRTLQDSALTVGRYLSAQSGPSAINILDVKKFGTGIYRIDYKSERAGELEKELLVLGQGYDKGWQAFRLKSDRVGQSQSKPGRFQLISTVFNQFKLFLPWFFGEKLEHVKVNGWENGWKISGNRQSAIGNSEDMTSAQSLESSASSVFILFWPQFLEWVGLALIPVVLAVISLKKYPK